MTPSEIRAELRRSACKDAWPFGDCAHLAYCEAIGHYRAEEQPYLWYGDATRSHQSFFFLLVAEALDD